MAYKYGKNKELVERPVFNMAEICYIITQLSGLKYLPASYDVALQNRILRKLRRCQLRLEEKMEDIIAND